MDCSALPHAALPTLAEVVSECCQYGNANSSVYSQDSNPTHYAHHATELFIDIGSWPVQYLDQL